MEYFQMPSTVQGVSEAKMGTLIGRKWWKHFLNKENQTELC